MLTPKALEKDELRERTLMRRAAVMLAIGEKNDPQIARELGIQRGTLEVFKRSPLFNEMVEHYSKEIASGEVKNVVDTVLDDAPRNIEFIKQVRDGSFTDPKDKMDSRLRASKMLLDKQVPNADAQVAADVGRVIIQGKLLGQMLRAMRNDGAIDVTADEIDEMVNEGTVAYRSPEEFKDRHEASEAASARESESDDDGSGEHPDDRL